MNKSYKYEVHFRDGSSVNVTADEVRINSNEVDFYTEGEITDHLFFSRGDEVE